MSTIDVTYETDEGEEIVLTLPSIMEVCHECGGESFVLCEGMRGYGYSAEEFAESFDEEERAEYFKSGGRYDVTCPTCNGKNVVPVVDEEHIPDNLKAQYEEAQKQAHRRAQGEAEDRATMRAECGYRE
jgi:RecJ-like exonuclease